MNPCRLFLSHEALDQWVGAERASINGDKLTDHQNGHQFELREGVRFLAEVTGQADLHGLVGKVKELEALVSLGGEHMADSVLLGDNAYQVQTGFVGRPLLAFDEVAHAITERPPAPMKVPTKAEMEGQTAGARQTIVALQNFFLNNVK